jgi:MFS family permease
LRRYGAGYSRQNLNLNNQSAEIIMKISQAAFMLIVSCALQNAATGTAYGSYGVILNDLIAQFGVSRSLASLGLALVALIVGLSSSIVGRMIDGWSLRYTAIIGLLLGGFGFGLAGIAHNFVIFLICFSVIGGLGVALSGQLTASTLVSRWFPKNTGLAIAIANLTLLLAVGPPVYGWITVHFGWRSLMFVLSGLFLLLLLPALFIKDHPAMAASAAAHAPTKFRFRDVSRNRAFWHVTISMGILVGAGIALVSHVVAFAIERGVAITTASWLLSISGVSAMFGGLLFGWLGDRFGAMPALTGNAALTCIAWFLLGMSHLFIEISLCVMLLGLCSGGLLAPVGAFIAKQFGANAFGSILGLMIQLILPLTFGGSIAVGALYDATHNYQVAFNLFAGLSALACVLLALLLRESKPAAALAP